MSNNINDNSTNKYTAMSMVGGGAAGVTTAFVTKPYLRKGSPKSSFLQHCLSNHPQFNDLYEHTTTLTEQVKKIGNMPELVKFVEDNKVQIPDWENIIARNNPEEAKLVVETCINIDRQHAELDILQEIKNTVKNWKNIKQGLKTNTENTSKETIDVVQKAIKSARIKYAIAFGIIGAGLASLVAGLVQKKNF